MAIKYAIEKHATAQPSKLLATNYGGHIYNVTLTTAADNGNIIKRGAYSTTEYDNYAEDTATTFNGIIRGQEANGEWLVEVLSDQGFDALFVYNAPVIEEDFTRTFMKESNFYNEKGDVVRAHQLYAGDMFAVSAEGFTTANGEGAPVLQAGKTITAISNKKLVVA